jgi:hypothetical protein
MLADLDSCFNSSLFRLSLRSLNPTAEDSLNIALREIAVTARDGRVSQLEQVYIRGSMVRDTKAPRVGLCYLSHDTDV